MKIYRSGTLTDSIKPYAYLSWKPGDSISLKTTIKAEPERTSSIDLQIEEEDIIPLYMAFLRSNPQRLGEMLAKELEKCDRENERLRSGLKNLRRITTDETMKQEIKNILWPRTSAKRAATS